MRQKVAAAWKRVVGIADDVGMFFLTVACVFISSYVPAFQAGTKFTIDFSIERTVVALFLGVIVTGAIELRGLIKPKDEETKQKIKAGRRKNAWLRVLLACLGGLAWPYIVSAFTRLLGLGQ